MSWDDEYPHSIYANVLLNENNEILNWRTGNYFWNEPGEAKMRIRDLAKIEKLSVKHKEIIVKNNHEHNKAFEVDAIEFYKQFKIAEDHIGSKPYKEV